MHVEWHQYTVRIAVLSVIVTLLLVLYCTVRVLVHKYFVLHNKKWWMKESIIMSTSSSTCPIFLSCTCQNVMCKIILRRTRRPPDRPDPDWSVVVRLRLFGADHLFGRDDERRERRQRPRELYELVPQQVWGARPPLDVHLEAQVQEALQVAR